MSKWYLVALLIAGLIGASKLLMAGLISAMIFIMACMALYGALQAIGCDPLEGPAATTV